MKNSHLKTPRTLEECHFVPGHSHIQESACEILAGYALAFALGVGMAVLLVAWWSS